MSLIGVACHSRFSEEPQYENVRLADPEEDLTLLLSADELVIPENKITLRYLYPLIRPMDFYHYKDQGFTREDLVRLISQDYKLIYSDPNNIIWTGDYRSSLDYLVLTGVEFKEGIYYPQVRV